MPPTSTAIAVRAAVQELQAVAFEARKPRMRTLDRAFVHTARLHPLQFFMADGKTPRVSFASALVKTVFIARRLRRQVGDQPMIGMLIPPSVAAHSQLPLMLAGRVPVNLNYTASNEVIASSAQQCGIDVVITSRAFLDRFPSMIIPGRTLLLEKPSRRRGSLRNSSRCAGVAHAGRSAQARTRRASRQAPDRIRHR